MMIVRRSMAALLFGALPHWTLAQQGEDPVRYSQQVIDAGNRTVTFVLDHFKPHFPDEHRELLGPGRVRVVVAADFNAFADYRARRVLLPAQMVGELLAQIQGIVVVRREPRLAEAYKRWFGYLTERSDRAMRRFAEGKLVDDEPIQSFAAYAGLKRSADLDAREAKVQEDMMIDSLALIIGHELGHLVNGHRPYGEISASSARAQEREADEFAADLMRRSDFSVLPGLALAYLRFAMAEETLNGGYKSGATHPRALCRFYRLGNAEMRRMLRDPDFTRHAIGVSIPQFRADLEQMKGACDAER